MNGFRERKRSLKTRKMEEVKVIAKLTLKKRVIWEAVVGVAVGVAAVGGGVGVTLIKTGTAMTGMRRVKVKDDEKLRNMKIAFY